MKHEYRSTLVVTGLTAILMATSALGATPGMASKVEDQTTPTASQPAPAAEFNGVVLPESSQGDASIELARSLLPEEFKKYKGTSHLIFTDSDWESLSEIRGTLRRTWSEYRGFCRRMGVILPRPDEKLVCIIFDEHDDFLNFAKKTEGDHAILELANGYFSPRYDWIALFEPLYHDSTLEAEQVLHSRQRELDAFQQRLDESDLPPDRRQQSQDEIDRLQRGIDHQFSHMEQWARDVRTAVTIHEAIHQFTHVCHTWPGINIWPMWLHEGLATAFETNDSSSGFGPDRVDQTRDLEFIELLEQERLIPLRDFISMKAYGDQSEATLSVMYPQTYGLMTWLYEYRTPQLAQYLKRLSAPPEEEGVQDPVRLFEEVFGKIDALEKRWHRIEKTGWRSKRH